MVRRIACINRKLFYHGDPELSLEVMEEVYGCPVELVTHGVPHRVLPRPPSLTGANARCPASSTPSPTSSCATPSWRA